MSKIKTGKLAVEFSHVEGFVEPGKRDFCGEVEEKVWLKCSRKKDGRKLGGNKFSFPRTFTIKEKRERG